MTKRIALESLTANVQVRFDELCNALQSTPAERTAGDFLNLCHAVASGNAAGLLAEWGESRRSEFAKVIQAEQQPRTGLFAAPVNCAPTLFSSADSANVEATSVAVRALRALGSQPVHSLSFLNDVTGEQIDNWMDTWDWTDPARQIDDIEPFLMCLIHHAEVDRSIHSPAFFHRILDRLETVQDRHTGLWGRIDTAPAGEVVNATRQIVSFFKYVHRPVQRVARITDSALRIYDSEANLFDPSPERNLAAIEILLSFAPAGYADAAICDVLVQCFDRMVEPEKEAILLETKDCEVVAGLVNNLIAVVSIARAYPGKIAANNVEFALDWPGPGFFPTPSRLTVHQQQVLPLWLRKIGPHVSGNSQKTSPAISVVIPCYNLGEYLHEALVSVDAQTTHDFEVIVVDDGSTDSFTATLLGELEHRGLTVLRQPNGGVASARNNAIENVRGRYICCLDPDDRIRPTFLEKALAILESTPDVGLVSGHFQLFDERDEVFQYSNCSLPEHLVHNQAVEPAVFRRQLWERLGGYSTSFTAPGIEDWDLWIGILRAGYRASVIPEIMWDYRVRPSQMSDSMYDPSTWSRICRELAIRHIEAYRENVADIVSIHSERWAGLRRYANDQERGIAWWQQQCRNWEQRLSAEAREHVAAVGELAAKHAAELEALQARIQELQQGLEWWRHQSENWQRSTEELQNAMRENLNWIEELTRAKQWWEAQASHWEKLAGENRE